MSYLYKVFKTEDPKSVALYSKIECYKIIETMRESSKYGEFFTCYYINSEKRRCHRRVGIEPGTQYDSNLSFWLPERDDEKAMAIIKDILNKRRDARKERARQEALWLIWMNDYIADLSIDKIKYI